MSLVAHQLKKDVRHFWLPLAVYFALLAVQMLAVPAVTSGLSEAPVWPSMLIQFNQLIVIVLTALVILDEPLAGSRAFWLSRPLAPGKLMASKLLFLFLFVILPALAAQLAALTSLGLEVGGWGEVVGEILLRQAAFVVVVVVVATLSPNLATFAVAGVAAIVMVVFGGYGLVALILKILGVPEYATDLMPYTYYSRVFLGLVLTVVLGGGIVVHQYLSRHTRRSLLLLLPALVLTHGIWSFASWDLLRPRPPFDTAPIRVTDAGMAGDPSFQRNDDHEAYEIDVYLKLEGAPADYAYKVSAVEGTLRLADGKVLRSRILGGSEWGTYASLERALGAPDFTLLGDPPRTPSRVRTSFFKASKTDFETYGQTAGRFTGRLLISARRYISAGRIPLREGAVFENGMERLGIDSVAVRPGRKPELDLDLKGQGLATLTGQLLFSTSPHRLFLQHRQRREALAIERITPHHSRTETSRTLVLSSPSVKLRRDSYRSQWVERRQAPVDAEWIRGAELLLVETVEVGRFFVPVEIEGFRMADDTLARHGG